MPPQSRIRNSQALIPPAHLRDALPGSASVAQQVNSARLALHHILHGADDRLAVVIGPCSVHDPEAALEYAARLAPLRARHGDKLEIIMRVYFEKPRTTVGWKGLINDPHLDGSFDINHGLFTARQLLLQINALGVPTATEFLDVISPHYLADLVAWGAIGARTTESQVHREMASGLPCPIGFKNGTDGNVRVAIDAMQAAAHPHHFLSISPEGAPTIVSSAGNQDCHVILRGGKTPNYDAASVEAACAELSRSGQRARLMIDASHANSAKKHENQIRVCADVGQQIAGGESRIIGVMVESNLLAGRQDLKTGCSLTFGQSITDACIGWDETEKLLEDLARAVTARRTLADIGIACCEPEAVC